MMRDATFAGTLRTDDQGRRETPWPFIPLIVFAFAVLGGAAYLGAHTRFMADDFCSAYYAQHFGLLRSIWYWYRTWSGRYTAFAFDWLILIKTFGRYEAGLFPPLMLALWLVAAVGATSTALRRAAPEGPNLLAALTLGSLFLSTTLLITPDVPQSFYWLNGLRAYSLPLVFFTFYAWLFEWSLHRLQSPAAIRWGCGAAFGLTFASGGLSEAYAAMQVALLTFLAGLQWFMGNKKRTPALSLLLASLLGAVASVIVIVLAPGNAVRQSYFPPPPSPPTLLAISMRAYLEYLSEIVAAPQKISALVGAVLAGLWIGSKYKEHIQTRTSVIAIVALAGIGLSFAGFLPGAYGYSEAPPPRTLSIATSVLAAFLLWSAFLAGSRLASSHVRGGVIMLATGLTALASVLSLQSVYQQRETYTGFAQLWDRVDAQILEAKAQGQTVVYIPALDNWADLDRPSDNPRFWATVCYSKYYGIQVYGPPYP